MFWEDLRKLLGGTMLYRLDSVISVRLVPIGYAVGLAAIALWAIDHLVGSFAASFSQGLWGILEIIIFAPLALVALRIASEMILVFFKSHEAAAGAVGRRRGRDTLLGEVSDAIHDLAEEDEDELADYSPAANGKPAGDVDPIIKGTARAAAKRTPPTKA
jgi:hypothetical protein